MWLFAPPFLTAGEERGLGGEAGKKNLQPPKNQNIKKPNAQNEHIKNIR
jgi:hypothetical protein